MGRRFGQLAGVFAFALVLGRLGRLLQSGPENPRWHLILIASVVLGGIVWWLIKQVVTSRWLSLLLFGIGGLVLFLRISVPNTLIAGILPTLDTPAALESVMDLAVRQIRHGVPPIVPSEGVIAILALLVWVVGALYTWGYTTGPALAMVLPSIVLYLQFAIFDRAQAGLGWMLASATMLALAITAMALERKRDVGRARDSEGRPKPSRSMTAAIVMTVAIGAVAVLFGNSATGVVSEYGNVPWRGGNADYGFGGGGLRLDRFVELQQTLISRRNIEVFTVAVGPQAPDLSKVYWTLETLDEFNGTSWGRSLSAQRRYEPGVGLSQLGNEYQGSRVEWTHNIYNVALQGPVAPVGGVPLDIGVVDGNPNSVNPTSFHYYEDSALWLPGELKGQEVYAVRAVYPEPEFDLGALATGSSGELSPLFANAAEAGEFIHQAAPPPSVVTLSEEDEELYTELPVIPRGVTTQARDVTQGASTNFERAWMLQHFFRDSGAFEYSVEVSTGSDALSLDRWLNDDTSLNYRTGYCEQFALSMAVMGRILGIPSRVVLGFTPGTEDVVGDGVRVVRVRDINAHAWVEMWMDGFGWVRFDPTPRSDDVQPVSLTAGFNPASFAPEPSQIEAPTPEGQQGFLEPEAFLDEPVTITPTPAWWLIGIVVAVLVVSITPIAKRIRRRRRLSAAREGDITAVWDELVDRLQDLGEPVAPTLTPIEFARQKDGALVPMAVSYSSTLYGGREGQASASDLYSLEGWVETNYDGLHRFRAAVNPRSLWKG